MKLGKASWLLLAIGVFVITFASLGAVRYQQVHQQKQLSEELTATELKLNGSQLEQFSSQQEAWKMQLSQALSQLETARAILSQPMGSIATSGILFDIAGAYGVEVTDLSSSGLTSVKLEGVPCSVITLTARVEGDVPALVSFITKLNSNLRTGVIQTVAISVPEITGEEKPSANIRLVVYSYQGD